MKRQFQNFRTVVNEKQSEILLRRLAERQAAGEIRSEQELKQALEEGLREIDARGRITIELPVMPWDKVTAERFKSFFEDLGLDIEVLFAEVDHSESVLDGLAELIATHVRNLQFSLGQLRSEVVQRRVRTPPGSGWSLISRDSFDRGYGKLLGRAELEINLFEDTRTGIVEDKENVPIKADARIEGIAKKLVLPETTNSIIGFKSAKVTSVTTSDVEVSNDIPVHNAVDGRLDTFWSHIVANSLPLVGEATATVTQLAGLSGVNPTVDVTDIKDPRHHEYLIKIIGYSGVNAEYVSLDNLEDFTGAQCQHDIGDRCRFKYDDFYSTNCTNASCSRYQPERTFLVSGVADLGDGFGFDTGIDIHFPNSGLDLRAGQTWKVAIIPSGTVGATVDMEMRLKKSSNINWIEIDPVIENPLQILSVNYTAPGSTTQQSITSGTIDVQDKIRLDFQKIEAEKIHISFNQETYEEGSLLLRPKQQAILQLTQAYERQNTPSLDELYRIPTEAVMAEFVSNGPARTILDSRSTKPKQIDGYFYQFGIFDISCGLTTYADTAIALTKEVRATTPRMVAIQPNLESDVSYAVAQNTQGTIEFDIVRFNFDVNGALINIDQVPLPHVDASGLITERLFLENTTQGYTRFAADEVSGIEILNTNTTLDSSDFSADDESGNPRRTLITLGEDVNLAENNSILIKYKPQYGVSLNQDRTVIIEDNREQQLSVSQVPALLSISKTAANRDIAYSDIHLKILLRRNAVDVNNTPGLRDYILLVNEGDEDRFF